MSRLSASQPPDPDEVRARLARQASARQEGRQARWDALFQGEVFPVVNTVLGAQRYVSTQAGIFHVSGDQHKCRVLGPKGRSDWVVPLLMALRAREGYRGYRAMMVMLRAPSDEHGAMIQEGRIANTVREHGDRTDLYFALQIML